LTEDGQDFDRRVDQKLKKQLSEIPLSKFIKDLSNGKLILQNEIMGDLQGEFSSASSPHSSFHSPTYRPITILSRTRSSLRAGIYRKLWHPTMQKSCRSGVQHRSSMRDAHETKSTQLEEAVNQAIKGCEGVEAEYTVLEVTRIELANQTSGV
jgi:hypothetical protein